MMKKLLLVLSLLSVVGLQAAECLPYVEVKTDRTHSISEKNRDVIITLTNGTQCIKNVWELEAAFTVMRTLVDMGSTVFKQDKNYMQAILAYGKNQSILSKAKARAENFPQGIYDWDTWKEKKQNAKKNYEFLKTFLTDEFEVV